MQSNLSFKNHINWITKKANNMLGFLRRNLRKANEETKTEAYFTMVRFNLDAYWTPYQRDQIYQIEMVQRRDARFVTNRYKNTSSVTDMLEYLGWDLHETRRSKLQLTILFRIVHGLIEIPSTEYLTSTTSRTRSAHSLKFQQHLQTATSSASFPRTILLCFIAIGAFVSNAL